MEKEKFELQKHHTETIQELLEDTNVRLSKMEGDYVVQMQSTVSVVFSVRLCTLILVSMTLLLVKFPGSQGKCQSWISVTTWSPSLTLTWTWTIR